MGVYPCKTFPFYSSLTGIWSSTCTVSCQSFWQRWLLKNPWYLRHLPTNKEKNQSHPNDNNPRKEEQMQKKKVTHRSLQSPSYKANQTNKREKKTSNSWNNVFSKRRWLSNWLFRSLLIYTSLPRRGSREVRHLFMVLSTFELSCIQLQSVLPEAITLALCHRHLQAHPLHMNSYVLL